MGLFRKRDQTEVLIETYNRQLRALQISRRAIVDAYEIERHRIERDLHDGAQQQLVAAAMKLGEVNMLLSLTDQLAGEQLVEIRELLVQAQDTIDLAIKELRETVRGVQPQMIANRGLVSAIGELIEKSPLQIKLVVPYPVPKLAVGVATTAYFAVSEAITNILKYAPDAEASVLITAGRNLQISIVDNGPGGAQIVAGHGLAHLRSRLSAFGGSLEISSPFGGPTKVEIKTPILLEHDKSVRETHEVKIPFGSMAPYSGGNSATALEELISSNSVEGLAVATPPSIPNPYLPNHQGE